MGGQYSKKTVQKTVEPLPPPPLISSLPDLQLSKADLLSYETACRLDPELQSFDTSLHTRTNRVINTIAVRSVSFDSLKEVTTCLLEMNQEVAKIILDCKKDIWKTQELFELVEEYFENSLQTLDFCTVLEKCLKRARDSQLLIHVALKQFEDDDGVNGKRYLKTMEELKNFKSAGDPFTEDFFQKFKSVYMQQALMLNKLRIRKSKIDKKLKSIKTWRKVSSVIFAAAFASVLICSVVAAAIAAPPVASALAAAASIPVGSMGQWFDSLWKNCEIALKGQKEVINSMQAGTYIALKDLDGIRVLVDRLEMEIESLMQAADFALRDDETVKFGIEEIRNKLGVFMQSIEDLGEHADKCSRDIRRARTVLLQRIIKHPTSK